MAAAGPHETGCGALGAGPVVKEWGRFSRKLFHRNAFPDPVHVRDDIGKPLELQVEDLALLAGMRFEHHHLTSPVVSRICQVADERRELLGPRGRVAQDADSVHDERDAEEASGLGA